MAVAMAAGAAASASAWVPLPPDEPDACEQARRALPVLCVACDPAESQGRGRQHRPRAGPEIETLVCDGVRRHLAAMDAAEPQTALADRELVQRHVARVIVKPQALDVWLIPTCEASAQAEDPGLDDP